jgi:uncharacterized membrane protein
MVFFGYVNLYPYFYLSVQEKVEKIVQKSKRIVNVRDLNLINNFQSMKSLKKSFPGQFPLTVVLVVCMILFTNIVSTNLFFIIARSILSLIFILFLPGFFITKILFKRTELAELIVLSVCLSICITIIHALILHLLSITINFSNILNPLSVTTLVLSSLVYWEEKVKR